MADARPDRVRLLLIGAIVDLFGGMFDERVHAFLCGFHMELQA